MMREASLLLIELVVKICNYDARLRLAGRKLP
jgi:hypothetical protein